MTSFRTRAAAAGAALAAALVLGVGLTPVPAQAAPPYEVDAWITSRVLAPMEEGLQRQELVMNLQVGFPRPGEEVFGVDLHVTLDILDDLGGLAFETDTPGCVANGPYLECDFADVSSYSDLEVAVDLLVPPSVAPYSKTQTTIKMYADDWDAVTFHSYWEFVPPEGKEADYAVEVESFQGVEPGGSVSPAVAFQNRSVSTFEDVLFVMSDGYLMDVDAQYSNCGTTGSSVVCVLSDLAPEPGAVYELSPDTPVTGTLDATAPGPREYAAGFSVYAYGQYGIELEDIAFFDADEELRFEPTDRAGAERTGRLLVEAADNPYDLVLDAGPLEGDAGDEVGLELTVSSLGPAEAISYAPAQTGAYGFAIAVQLPTGVEWADTDDGYLWSFSEGNYVICVDAAKDENVPDFDPAYYRVERIDGYCWLRANSNRSSIPVGETTTVVLPAVVTGEVDASDGLAAVVERHRDEVYPDLDGNPDDNVVVLELDVGEASGGNPTGTPGESSGGDGTAAKLPRTGSSQTGLFAGGAVLALVGALLAVAARRRRIAG